MVVRWQETLALRCFEWTWMTEQTAEGSRTFPLLVTIKTKSTNLCTHSIHCIEFTATANDMIPRSMS